MLIDHETAGNPYGTMFTVLHHSHFPAFISNNVRSSRHA